MKKERIFWGVFFILAAVFLIVSGLGIFEEVHFWDLILTVFFAAWLLHSIAHKSITGVLFSIAFLCIIYADPLGIEELVPWPVLGAALLGSIGCGILFRPEKRYHSDWEEHHRGGHIHSEYGAGTKETVEGQWLEFVTSFSSSIKYVNSDDLLGGDVKCSFGGMKIYFDNALIQRGRADIRLEVAFGGVNLYVPRHWNVVNKVEAVFAGVKEENQGGSPNGPVLNLEGKTCFGGVTVIYI